jgi:hypothetical protein
MSQQIKDHNIESLMVAGRWPGADRATLITLARCWPRPGPTTTG